MGSLFLELRGDIDSSTFDSNIASVVPCISSAITKLLDNGEKNIIVSNFAPAYDTPLAATYGTIGSDMLKGIIFPMYEPLKQAVAHLSAAYPSANVLLWDAPATIQAVYDGSVSYNFTDITNPCLQLEVSPDNLLGLLHPQLVSVCPDPSKYAFW